MPLLRRRPLLRAAAVGGGAYALGKHNARAQEERQQEAYDQVTYIPLGQFTIPSAWRKSITGVLDGPATPIFWNVDKSE